MLATLVTLAVWLNTKYSAEWLTRLLRVKGSVIEFPKCMLC